jgi:hypothetical protein
MIAYSYRFLKVTIRAAGMLAGLIAASCAPHHSSPEQVRSSNPSVTYKYSSDQELVQANQRAAKFCNRYQSVPGATNFAKDPDGSGIVVFECVETSATSQELYNPNLTYNYRTDQELLDASRNAQIYCMNNGSQQIISNIVTNANGTKTVTFQCSSG